ncbi:DNA translocase FtsK [Streptomyces actinomycinicus]|uniref:DNA translocase FtsK n=1 Tax=Streptomyces actinomycinicus TaxID=1695166 RepID=UPI001F2B9762|nr:DNA translocase FtsK [Streptomyces actinomycinicus]
MTEIDTNPVIGAGLDRRLVWDAAELVVSTQFGSRSMLQRKLRITWAQTELVMDELERLGVVGPDQGSRAREVHIRLVEDLEPVFNALMYGETITMDTVVDAALAEPADETLVLSLPPELPHLTLTKVPAEPAAPGADPDDDGEPEPEHSRSVEGTAIYTSQEWELREDPEGDRPWINPQLRTREGRRGYLRFLRRQARRRMRKSVARQRTPHGLVPRMWRGHQRVRAWVVGIEGAKAKADLNLAQVSVKEAHRAARRAQRAIRDRDKKRQAAVALQMESGKHLVVAKAARDAAQRAMWTRAGLAYGPVVVVDGATFGLTNVWGLLAALMVNMLGLAWVGRDVELTEEELARLEQIEDGMPQEVTIGMTPRVFQEMMREALVEKLKCEIKTLRVDPLEYAYVVHVWLDGMTPKKIADGLADLEANLPGVRTSSILLRQSSQSRNYCVLTIPGPNAWAGVPELPYREPKSLTTADIPQAQVAAAMSGDPLGLPLERTHVNMVGKSRSGKSTWLRAILDVLTATTDQIVIGIDLGSAGSGFAGLRHAMHLVITDPYLAAEALDWGLAVGQGRPDLFDELGMGQTWVTSPARPGVKFVVDEFPALVNTSRKCAIYDENGKKTGDINLDGKLAEMIDTCAKSDVTVIVAGQGMTRARVGANTWLNELPVQILAACDEDDIKLALSAGAMDEGWAPHRLMPQMGQDVNDAGVAYVLAGSRHSEPIPYRACITSSEEYERRGRERGQHLIAMDAESEEFSEITLEDLMAKQAALEESRRRRRPSGPPVLITTIRGIFRDANDPAGLSREELAEALGEVDPDTWALDNFDGDEDEQLQARIDAVRVAVDAVLEPTGHSWPLEKYSKNLPRGWRLRDLKVITGEAPSES